MFNLTDFPLTIVLILGIAASLVLAGRFLLRLKPVNRLLQQALPDAWDGTGTDSISCASIDGTIYQLSTARPALALPDGTVSDVPYCFVTRGEQLTEMQARAIAGMPTHEVRRMLVMNEHQITTLADAAKWRSRHSMFQRHLDRVDQTIVKRRAELMRIEHAASESRQLDDIPNFLRQQAT